MPRDPRQQACVLFFGQTGVEKLDRHHPTRRTVASALSEQCVEVARRVGDDAAGRWEAFSFEDYLSDDLTVREFIPQYRTERQAIWNSACKRLSEDVQSCNAEVVGVFLHAHYWHRGELFNHLNLRLLAELNPTLVVTLIDDAFDIHSRIQFREDREASGGETLTIGRVLTWRWTEISLADVVAGNVRNVPLRHFVVSVKHPAEMLYRLLFDRRHLPVYASFPITKVRLKSSGPISRAQRDALRADINSFRRKLRERGFVVFDPVTIDELRIDTGSGELSSRWPLEDFEPMIPRLESLHPRTMEQLRDAARQASLTREIERQVVPRDFRMIDGVNAVVSYRPMALDGTHSLGTREELRYGMALGRRIIVVHDEAADGGPYLHGAGPFGDVVVPKVFQHVDGALRDLDDLQQKRIDHFARSGESVIWTDSVTDRNHG